MTSSKKLPSNRGRTLTDAAMWRYLQRLEDRVGDLETVASGCDTTFGGGLTLAGDILNYEATNDANPKLCMGSSATEALCIQAVYDSGAQTLDYALFETFTASATADKGKFVFRVDETEILEINDSGLNITGGATLSGNIAVTGTVDGRDIAADGTTLDTLDSVASKISTDSAAPSTAPSKVGDIFIDTSANAAYVATGTSSSSDWEQIDGGGSGNTTTIEVDGVQVNTSDATLDFDGTDFTLTESPVDDFDITINAERIQDIAGAMVTGNTETGITVTYQDADGTLDFTVSDTTVAGDTGSTAITPGDTLTIAGGTEITTSMSGDTLTINSDFTPSSTDTLTNKSGNISQWTNDSGYITATLTNEEVQDIVGAMVTGNTETLISVTYQDADGTLDFVVDEASIDHDALTNFVANEHIDWTSTSSNLDTSGTLKAASQTFLNGGTIAFRDSGDTVDDIVITHSTNDLAFTGASGAGDYSFDHNVTISGNIAVTGTVDGRDIATDGTKLDGIEASADVTDEANVTDALDGATLSAVTVAADDKILIQDTSDSDILKTVDPNDIADLKVTELSEDTTPVLSGQLDVNGQALGDGTRELLTFTEDASAVNHINIENEATGSGPILSAAGDDTNIDINIAGKGTGNINLGNYSLDGDQTVGAGQDNYVLTYDNGTGLISLEAAAGGGGDLWSDPVDADIVPDADGTRDLGSTTNRFAQAHIDQVQFEDGAGIYDDASNEQLLFTKTASAVNYLTITNAASGSRPILGAAGGDTNIGIDFLAKGSGDYNFRTDGNTYLQATDTAFTTAYFRANTNGIELDDMSALNTSEVTCNDIFGLSRGASPGYLRFYEASTNGTNYLALQAPSSVTSSTAWSLPDGDGTSGQLLSTDGAGNLSWASVGAGDVSGPASSTDNAIVRFDGTGGKTLQDSGVTVDDSDNISGVNNIYMSTSTGILEPSGPEFLLFTSGGINNYINITNSNTGTNPTIASAGDGTNVGLTIDTKGTGTLVLGSADSGIQIGNDLDTNGQNIDFDDATGIRDDSGNEQLIFQKTTSAVNHIEITNAATGNDPKISAAGDDANIDIDIEPKGTGNVILGNYSLDGDQSVGAGQDDYVLTYNNSTGLISLEAASGGFTAATQAQQETGSDNTVGVTPAVQQYHDSACKFWVNFTGSGGSINDSYNVTSVTDNGTGDATVTIATDFSSSSWVLQAAGQRNNATERAMHAGFDNQGTYTLAVGSARFYTFLHDSATKEDALTFWVCGWGDQ